MGVVMDPEQMFPHSPEHNTSNLLTVNERSKGHPIIQMSGHLVPFCLKC